MTNEQREALVDYQATFGDEWTRQLQTDWMRGGSRWHGEFAYLMQLRNDRDFVAEFNRKGAAQRLRSMAAQSNP
jgi:hypothetical protein